MFSEYSEDGTQKGQSLLQRGQSPLRRDSPLSNNER